MLCPFCKRLIHPDSYSCQYCGSFVRNDMPSPTPFERQEEQAAQRAGDQGEEWLLSVFGLYSKSRNVHRFAQKRLPAGDKRCEIDLLAVTPKRLYVFEVKNWSGTLFQQGDSWVQLRRNDETLKHENALDVNREKAQALLRYLETKGIVIPDGHLSCKVFLVHERLRINDAIAQQTDVLYPSKLGYRINAETIIDYCLYHDAHDASGSSHDKEMRSLFPHIVDEINQLKTWDRIYRHGHVIYKGDIINMRTGNDVALRDDMRSGMTIEVHWSRHEDETRQLLYEMLDVKQGILVFDADVKVAVGNNDAVLFHRPGDEHPLRIPFKHIEKIVIG